VKHTNTGLKPMASIDPSTLESGDVNSHYLALGNSSPMQPRLETSEHLSISVPQQLFKLMQAVTDGPIDPAKVKAACACADQIHKILKTKAQWGI
jgi:hypothetical protein